MPSQIYVIDLFSFDLVSGCIGVSDKPLQITRLHAHDYCLIKYLNLKKNTIYTLFDTKMSACIPCRPLLSWKRAQFSFKTWTKCIMWDLFVSFLSHYPRLYVVFVCCLYMGNRTTVAAAKLVIWLLSTVLFAILQQLLSSFILSKEKTCNIAFFQNEWLLLMHEVVLLLSGIYLLITHIHMTYQICVS